MVCPYLEYRREASDQSFDVARAYCSAADEFVQPMRADICNDRYALRHDEDCEIYLAHADDVEAETGDDAAATAEDDAGSATGDSGAADSEGGDES